MELDGNHAVRAEGKNNNNAYMNCDGDHCGDKIGCARCFSSSSSSSSSPNTPASLAASSSIYLELWHACAGPLTSLPKRGDVVVYFPQGHLEQVASNNHPFSPMEMPTYDLKPQIVCTVANVQRLVIKHFHQLVISIMCVCSDPPPSIIASEPYITYLFNHTAELASSTRSGIL